MKLSHFFLVRKIAFVSFFFFLVCNTQAQVTLDPKILDGSYGSPNISVVGTGDACLDYTGGVGNNQTFQLTGTGLNAGSINYTWSVEGGIELVSSSGNQATVRPIIDSEGRYNKGRLTVLYDGLIDTTVTVTSCPACNGEPVPPQEEEIEIPKSGGAYVDLFQKFEYDDPIIGVECIAGNDSLAYSIRDLVSGNIADGIGIDEYFWDYSTITDHIKDNEPAYESGDNSALTFAFDNAPGENDSLKVIVGKCNQEQDPKFLLFGQKIPEADLEVSGGSCVPVSQNEVTIINNEPETGLVYEWIPGNPNFTFAAGEDPNDPDEITIVTNYESGYVLLKAQPDPMGSNYCSESGFRYDTIWVNRELGSASLIKGDTCVAIGRHTYTIVPNPGEGVSWSLPTGWEIVGGSANENASTIQVDIDEDSQSGTITVATLSCPSGEIDTVANMKPGSPGPIASDDTCIVYGSTAGIDFSVTTATHATSYAWSLPDGWTITSGSGTTSITAQPSGTTIGTVSVTALGDCNSSDTVSIEVQFGALTPDSVITSNCINSGKPDEVTFEVYDPVPGQTYDWAVPSGSGWSIDSYQNIGTSVNARVTMSTDGVDGSYDVPVRGISQCDTSAYYNHSVSVTGIDAVVDSIVGFGNIQYAVLDDYLSNGGQPLAGSTTYQWYSNSAPISGETNYNITLNTATPSTLAVEVSLSGENCFTWFELPSSYSYSLKRGNFSNSTPYIVHPNPADDSFRIQFTEKYRDATLIVRTLQGETMVNTDISGAEKVVATSQFSAGVYVIELNIDGKNYTDKVVIKH